VEQAISQLNIDDRQALGLQEIVKTSEQEYLAIRNPL